MAKRNSENRNGGKDRPAHSIEYPCRGGNISVAAWEKTIGEGENERIVYGITFKRSYNDEEWKETTYLRPEDIPILNLALERVYEWVLNQGRR